MAGLLAYGLAGAVGGLGQGLVERAKFEREDRLRELIHGQRREIAQMGIDARSAEGEADRASRADLQAERLAVTQSEGAADRGMRTGIAAMSAGQKQASAEYRQQKDVNDLAAKLWEADQNSFGGDKKFETFAEAQAAARAAFGMTDSPSPAPAPGGGGLMPDAEPRGEPQQDAAPRREPDQGMTAKQAAPETQQGEPVLPRPLSRTEAERMATDPNHPIWRSLGEGEDMVTFRPEGAPAGVYKHIRRPPRETREPLANRESSITGRDRGPQL